MQKAMITSLALVLFASTANATIVYSENFDTATGTSTIIPGGWVEEGLTGDNAGVEGGFSTTPDFSVWFNTGAGDLREEAIYKDTGVANDAGSIFTLSYDLIGRTPYTGDFLAELYVGEPGNGGVLLNSAIGINPATNQSTTNQVVANGTAASGNIFIRFYANDFDGAESGAFQQARMDTVSLDQSPIPEPASLALVGIAGLLMLRRRG